MAQLADSLIDPIWRRILQWSWPAKALVLLIILGIILIFSFPDSAKVASHLVSNLIRVVRADGATIPIDPSIFQKSKETATRLSASLDSFLQSPNKFDDSTWPAAQATVANYSTDNSCLDVNHIVSFVRSAAEPDCGCWREIPGDSGKPINIFISGWVLLALAQMDVPATQQEYLFLVNEQNFEGWWSVFPVEYNQTIHNFASSYGTAMALLGLNAQLKKNLVHPTDKELVSTAVHAGSAWLLGRRESGSRWKDYPHLVTGELSASISGVVLHALHQTTSADRLESVDSEWLDNLPPGTVSAKVADRPFVWLKTKEGKREIDAFVYIQLPWLLVGTVDAYRNGTIIQRTKALEWIETALGQTSVVTADTLPDPWWRAEILYAINYVLANTSNEGR